MNNWQFDIIKQTGWDLWVWVCIAASLVLLFYAVAGRLWTSLRGWARLTLILIGLAGTTFVIIVPAFHTPMVGLVWTFLLLAILSATFYLNLHDSLGTRRTSTLLALRVLSLALLVPMLFEPVVRYVARPKPERPLLFLIDTSGSMSFPDVQNGPTRIQSIWQTLRPQLSHVRDHFVPRFFTFNTDCQELTNIEDLASKTADGKSTDVVAAVAKTLAASTRDDASIVLISDGIDNTSANVVDAIRASRRPIHTILVGSDQAEPATMANVAVDNVEAADDFIVGHESTVKATVKSSALANRVIDVRMNEIDLNGKPIGQEVTKKLVLQPVREGQSVELPYKPASVGVHRLAVWIDPIVGERSTVDNRQEFQGLALDPRVKILYIEGRARPEYQNLNRALKRDSNIETASLLRLQQDRFTAAGTVDGDNFKSMPTSSEQWKKFDVIILGDLDSTYLPKIQQAAIEQRVAEGAGLLMIGGTNSFGPGAYQNSLIEKALPVFVGDTAASQEKSEFIPRLTPDGLTHPAMEGLAEWFGSDTQKAEKTLLPLRGNVVVPKPKSGAQILLTHHDRPGPDGKPQIVLAVQRYGQGRSAAFTADTTYLWYLQMRGMGQDSPYNRFWGQLVRWLAGEDVRSRQHGAGIEGLLNKSTYSLGESVRVRAMVRDDKGDATRYAQVQLLLKQSPAAKPQQLPMAPSEARTGMYEVTIPTPEKGDWSIDLIATKDNKKLGQQTLKFTVLPPADEMLKIAANPPLLAAIADQTKGFSYPLAQLPTLIDELIRNDPKANGARQLTIPLHNTLRTLVTLTTGRHPTWPETTDLPMQGTLVLLLLAAEWLLRRHWQLP